MPTPGSTDRSEAQRQKRSKTMTTCMKIKRSFVHHSLSPLQSSLQVVLEQFLFGLIMMRSLFSFILYASTLYAASAYGKIHFVSSVQCDTLGLTLSFSVAPPVAPSFVPRSHGVVSPMPKNVVSAQVFGSTRKKASSGAASIKMMPIGVPKVAYRVPGSQQADWYGI